MPKHSRFALTLEQKQEIIRDVEKGAKNVEICRKYNLSSSTVSTVVKQKNKIFGQHKFGDGSKRMRKSTYADVEDALFLWLKDARTKSVPVSGPLLKEKANKFAKDMGVTFNCSDGWLDRFKRRKDVTFRVISGEAHSAPQQSVDHWLKNELPKILLRYEEKDVFNADETGLFFKLLPEKTHTFKGDSCHGGKRSKERLTVLIAANMDGSEKLPLVVIGKSANPRCFKNVRRLPVIYRANKKAWMTADLYEEWLFGLDRKFTARKRKVLMVIDNCSAHTDISDKLKSIELVFLPPNCTSKLQPCDMGIIQNFKVLYR